MLDLARHGLLGPQKPAQFQQLLSVHRRTVFNMNLELWSRLSSIATTASCSSSALLSRKSPSVWHSIAEITASVSSSTDIP
ncbi:hypothetical protein PCASD_00680 [Puccinia coronata f. sp. avenae]|uniref:Uncharacterized protein n=1 Tax=Puccinia coronata f. sp. avenae TaxID=200324 RepID=A0A2N5VL69_9BASI|nr:hypothetical protein PCASD_00680 [Puccinia coronata f. sp. avenae]